MIAPIMQLLFVFQSGGIPLGVPAAWGGGLDRFPVVRGSRRRFVVVVPSAATVSPDLSTIVDEMSRLDCIASTITQQVECTTKHRIKDRSRHRAAEPSAIVSSLSKFRPR